MQKKKKNQQKINLREVHKKSSEKKLFPVIIYFFQHNIMKTTRYTFPVFLADFLKKIGFPVFLATADTCNITRYIELLLQNFTKFKERPYSTKLKV